MAAGLRAHLALLVWHDLAAAAARAQEASELARAVGAVDVEVLALAQHGLVLVSRGQVTEWIRRLDEATAAALAGEVSDPDAIATTCCYLIYACKRVPDWDRAARWCVRVQEISKRFADRSTFAACRTHYADVLIIRSSWALADEVLAANWTRRRRSSARPARIRSRWLSRQRLRSTVATRSGRPSSPSGRFGGSRRRSGLSASPVSSSPSARGRPKETWLTPGRRSQSSRRPRRRSGRRLSRPSMRTLSAASRLRPRRLERRGWRSRTRSTCSSSRVSRSSARRPGWPWPRCCGRPDGRMLLAPKLGRRTRS